jgi:hypothetical protein
VRAAQLTDLVYKNGQAGIQKATVTITFANDDPSVSPVGYEDREEITVMRQVVVLKTDVLQIFADYRRWSQQILDQRIHCAAESRCRFIPFSSIECQQPALFDHARTYYQSVEHETAGGLGALRFYFMEIFLDSVDDRRGGRHKNVRNEKAVGCQNNRKERNSFEGNC